jgi:ABC-type uncharacterized transport system permease subunit
MTEEEAKKRFMILNVVRFTAIAIVFAGIANIGGKLLPDLSPFLGYALLIAGVIDFFVAPMLLKRIWQNEGR